jgi:hypothetical protein
MNDTIDALESLIKSEGWRLMADLARKEWTERERTGRRNALNDTDDKRALDKLRQITAAQEAVEWVLSLPSEEIARLRRQELTEPILEPVRTPLSVAMAGQSRRGRL